MRHPGGRSEILAWCVALSAFGACSGALRSSVESLPAPTAAEAETCVLGDAPSHAADTATVIVRGAGDGCALKLVAGALRPWPAPSDDPWAVQITLTGTGAIAHRLSGERARDAVDAGVSRIATEDLDLVAYAAARPELEVTPLPWDRTYFRLAPGAVSALGAELPADAVSVDARHAEALSCDTILKPAAAGTPTSTRVIYQIGDRTARELAERMVAIMGGTTTTVALGPAKLDDALRAGDDLAYIVSVPRPVDQGCDTLAALARRAPWLAPHSILPLVDTRAHVIAPRAPPP
jgi:hypothetical protein